MESGAEWIWEWAWLCPWCICSCSRTYTYFVNFWLFVGVAGCSWSSSCWWAWWWSLVIFPLEWFAKTKNFTWNWVDRNFFQIYTPWMRSSFVLCSVDASFFELVWTKVSVVSVPTIRVVTSSSPFGAFLSWPSTSSTLKNWIGIFQQLVN